MYGIFIQWYLQYNETASKSTSDICMGYAVDSKVDKGKYISFVMIPYVNNKSNICRSDVHVISSFTVIKNMCRSFIQNKN